MPTSPAAAKNPAARGPATKSCATCPSNLDLSTQGNAVGRSIGAPVCGAKLIPLLRPGAAPATKTMPHFASNCDRHGEEVQFNSAAKTAPIEYSVAFPDLTMPEPAPNDAKLSTCATCVSYVPPQQTRKLTGWSAGFCRAKGALLLDDRLPKYAAVCDKGVFQPQNLRIKDIGPRPSINIVVLPEYSEDFGKPKPYDLFAVHKTNLAVAPADYPTDKPVPERFRRMGIRALRRIEDPKRYGPDIFVPIMDSEAKVEIDGKMVPLFSDSERELIPKSGGEGHPERYFDHGGTIYRTMVMWLKLRQTPALWGEAGVGKTEVVRHAAWMMGMPFYRISITETTEVDDIIGKMMFSPERGTYFQYGQIPRALRRPGVTCLDEPNTGQPAVWQRIRPLTDDSRQLVIDTNEAERVPMHPLSYLAFAMNPAWDPRNTGVAELADADGSRLMHIAMTLPPENVERQILLETLQADGWDTDEANKAIVTLMSIAKDIRRLSNESAIPVSWGIRNQKKVLRVKRYAGWLDSFRMGVTDALEPTVGSLILEVVKSYDDSEDMF